MTKLWSQRNAREKILIAACIIAAVIAIPMLLTPPDSGSSKLLPAAKAKQEFDLHAREKLRLESEVDKLKPRIEKLVYKDAPEKVLPGVIRQLQAQARKAGIHIREIKPMRSKKMVSLTKVPLTVRFASRFDQSLPFIYSLEDPVNKMVVEKFSISSPDSKSKTVDVEIQMALFTSSVSAADAG